MAHLAFKESTLDHVISVIIPVYKDHAGLRDTVESIQSCRLPEEKQLELIVVNDGADPQISSYCEDRQVVELRIYPNKGSYYARNRGLEHSRGAVIGFVDADIIVEPDWLIEGVHGLQQADYVAGHIQVFSQGANQTAVRYQQLVDFNSDWHMKSMKYGPTANVWIKRQVAEKIGGFDEELFSGGDMDYGIRVHRETTLVPAYDPKVRVSHPPRTLKGLFDKSKRLAYGHTVIQGHQNFEGNFSVWSSVKRNLLKGSGGRKIPFDVQVLRLALYAHRLFFKVFYKLMKRETDFQRTVQSQPRVEVFDHQSGAEGVS